MCIEFSHLFSHENVPRVFCGCVVVYQALRDWVAIESDSANVLKRPDLHRMMEATAQKLRQMGGAVELVDIGEQEVSDTAKADCHYFCLINMEPCTLSYRQ